MKETVFEAQVNNDSEKTRVKQHKIFWYYLSVTANPTSYPGSSLFLPRESTLVSAGHVAPKIWVLTRMCHRGGVAKCKIVTSVRMVESTVGDVSFFRNICGDKKSFHRQVFLHYIRTFDIEAVHVIFDSEKHVYKSLNFKTLSLTIAIVNGSRSSKRNGVLRIRKD